MADTKKCSRCGAELPPDAPGGHCPQCLLNFAVSSEDAAADPGENFPNSPTPQIFPTEKPGDRIGRYKLLQQIGEGGMGVVWMAEQTEPVRRKVALKVVKLGMGTRMVIARFAAERQALALMDHPNIAKVLDAGATDTGRPYFVMELVRGIKITDYCDQKKLTLHHRLDLFVKVCEAIQHAHQNGIVHRDIKPSNVLVTEQDGVPTPKIIDFGIAKATTGERLTDKTLFTAIQQFIGTPAYMSPEHAGLGGLDIDARSDIYSLGVLLYELLTNRQPFDSGELHRAALDEILHTLREKEPPLPSVRLTALSEQELTLTAERHQIAPAKLPSLLRGDLDWIVMKALEKDRRRRYDTAKGFAADVQRYLDCEPVIARPPTAIYRFQKWVRRNKPIVITSSIIAVILLASGLGFAYLTIRPQPIQPALAKSPAGSWRYSELQIADPNNAKYFPSTTDEYSAATFRGYVTFAKHNLDGPQIFNMFGNTGYQIFTTWVMSRTNRTLNLVFNGDDGHSLFIDGQFLGGGGYGVVQSNTISLAANVPRKLEFALYNSIGGWGIYMARGPWTGWSETNWTNLLEATPGLTLNADDDFGGSQTHSSHSQGR